jgi:transaldolase
LIGFVDGQTTNPSLIAKQTEIQRRLASGHQLSEQEEKDAYKYKNIVQNISPLVGDDGVSIEVFADLDSRAEQGVTGMGSSRAFLCRTKISSAKRSTRRASG